jgi:hypothetical protein
MTITPEKLRELADDQRYGHTPTVRGALRQSADALETALAEVQRLSAPRRVTTKPHDDCECVVCETMRNPPKPSEFLLGLMRKHKAAGHKDLRK